MSSRQSRDVSCYSSSCGKMIISVSKTCINAFVYLSELYNYILNNGDQRPFKATMISAVPVIFHFVINNLKT